MEFGMTGRLEMSISLNRPLMVVVAVNPAAIVAPAVPVFIARESTTNMTAVVNSTGRIHSLGKINSNARGAECIVDTMEQIGNVPKL